jgi:hypothetical protein
MGTPASRYWACKTVARLQRQGRVDGGRPGQHREAAGKAAQHDVEPGPALEPDRIDDAVDEGAQEDVAGGGPVGGEAGQQHRRGQEAEDDREPDRAAVEITGDEGAVPGARHAGVEIAFHIVIEGAGTGRRQENGEAQQRHLPAGEGGAGRHRDAGERAQHDGQADPELEEAPEVLSENGHPRLPRPGRKGRPGGGGRGERPAARRPRLSAQLSGQTSERNFQLMK